MRQVFARKTLFCCLRMEKCAVFFILRQSALRERSFLPPGRRGKLQKLFPGCRREQLHKSLITSGTWKGQGRKGWNWIFPVQKQELFGWLLLLPENIPSVPANLPKNKKKHRLGRGEKDILAGKSEPLQELAFLAGDILFATAAGWASVQEVFLGEARRAFPRAPRSAAGRKLHWFRLLRSAGSAAPPGRKTILPIPPRATFPSFFSLQIHFLVSKWKKPAVFPF